MKDNKLTPEQALETIGKALAHPGLKLSQGEHLALIECYTVLQEVIKPKPI